MFKEFSKLVGRPSTACWSQASCGLSVLVGRTGFVPKILSASWSSVRHVSQESVDAHVPVPVLPTRNLVGRPSHVGPPHRRGQIPIFEGAEANPGLEPATTLGPKPAVSTVRVPYECAHHPVRPTLCARRVSSMGFWSREGLAEVKASAFPSTATQDFSNPRTWPIAVTLPTHRGAS